MEGITQNQNSNSESNTNQNMSSQRPHERLDMSNYEDQTVIDEQAKLIKKIKKSDLHPFLKCSLCTGFYRDAHTINECLDTFCKSCIYKYFCEDTNRETCPKCHIHLGGRPL